MSMFLSLDGVIQGPGGAAEDTSGGFALGGWFIPLSDDRMGAVIRDLYTRATGFLLGRRTYDIWAGHWPKLGDDDPIARALNHHPKYVVSTTLQRAAWAHTTIIADDVVARLRALKADGGGTLLTQGSSQLARTLIANGLVDEYVLFTAPVILGAGKRLFGDDGAPAGLALVESQVTSTGVVVARYRPSGPVAREEAPPSPA